LDVKSYELKVEKLKAISHPHRLCIIKGLMENSCNVSKIQECLKLPQSTVSQHLSKLRSAGIIEGTRNGLEICYSVVDEDVRQIVTLITKDMNDIHMK
jgi:ArsR family transcriptional regulator